MKYFRITHIQPHVTTTEVFPGSVVNDEVNRFMANAEPGDKIVIERISHPGNHSVNLRGGRGVVIGNNNNQTNVFT
jgi:hypothetical protein